MERIKKIDLRMLMGSSKSKVYVYNFVVGTAMVKAKDKKTAWEKLKKQLPGLEPLEKCNIEEVPRGTVYF